MSTCSMLSLSDIQHDVSDFDNQAHRQAAINAQSTHGCKCAVTPNFSWIKLREQRWFCGWIWGVDAEYSAQSQSSPINAVSTSSKPVTVNELASYSGTASSLQAKVAQSQADIKKLLDSLQNFSYRMEKQAATSALATPMSIRLANTAKRVAFLSDLPDDVILKCLSLLTPNCLCTVAQSCKRLRSIASADNLWQPLSFNMWSRLRPQPPQSFKQMYRITWGKWIVALEWLQWARSMGHPASLSGKVHKGEAITAMSIITVLCDISPPHIIETLANLAAPLSVQAFLRGDDAILVSHSLPCLAAMATVPVLASVLDKVDCARTISKSLPPFSMCFRDNARSMTQALVNLCIPSMAVLSSISECSCGPQDKWRPCAWQQGVSSWEFVFAISRGVTQYRSQMEVQYDGLMFHASGADEDGIFTLQARLPNMTIIKAFSHNEENVAVPMSKTYSSGACVDCIAFSHVTGMFGLWGSGKSRGFFRGCALLQSTAT